MNISELPIHKRKAASLFPLLTAALLLGISSTSCAPGRAITQEASQDVVNEIRPIVDVTPVYPSRAAARGIEGWCQVSFTITETGRVQNVGLVTSRPRDIFDASCIRAAQRLRFEPQIENGRNVAVAGVRHVFRFDLEAP